MFKHEYLGRIEYDFQKSRVTGPWDYKVSVSAKKVKKKISCLCTFKVVQPNYIFMAFVPHMAISATEGLGTRALKERTIAAQIHGLFTVRMHAPKLRESNPSP
jgi:hypothetical protein